MARYAPLFLVLLATSSVQANGWEWRRQPVTAEDYCEIKRIARLTPLSSPELDSVMEYERTAFNDRTLLQYNRVLPIPLPMMPTPEVGRRPVEGFIGSFIDQVA